MKFKNFVVIIISAIIFISCTLTPNIKKSGINNLGIIQEKFIINTTNKNDVLNELGESILTNYPNNNIWVYIETEIQKKFFGRKELLKNDVLVVSFNNKGILVKKNLYTKDYMMKVSFDEEFTRTYSINENFYKKFFASIRKRFVARENSLKK
jgi:outer membrane protein assembly factor BamE (lipoprotein component of BamABCDE complex)